MWSLSTAGKLLATISALIALYQVYCRWRAKRALRKLSGKVVLITGASSGVGEALARVFHSSGARVILAGRNVQKLQQLKFQLDSESSSSGVATPPGSPRAGPGARYTAAVIELDLSKAGSLVERMQEALALFGHVDILINNAGVSSRSSVMETDMSIDRKVMEVNFFGPIAITKALLPSMLERSSGHIVVISSLQGKIGLPFRSSYSASKHALQGYFDSLRSELTPRGLQVTIVSPGYVKTQLSVNALMGDGGQHGVMDPSTAKGMSSEHVAHQVMCAVAQGKRDVLLANAVQQAAVYLQLVSPALLDWILTMRAKVA